MLDKKQNSGSGAAIRRRNMSKQMRLQGWRGFRRLAAVAVIALPFGLAGCGSFFVCDKASCPASSSTSTSTTGDYFYATNSTSGVSSINGYTLSNTTLTATTSSPYALAYTPTAMAVSINNNFLYYGSNSGTSGGANGIYGYSIGTGGALTSLQSTALATTSVGAMTVSPDGQWLVVVNNGDGAVLATSVTDYSINSSTGQLSLIQTLPIVSGNGQTNSPTSIKVAPTGQFIAVSLGTGGFAVIPFTTSTGAMSPAVSGSFSIGGAIAAIGELAIDANNYLYLSARTELISLLVSSAGVAAATTTSTAATSTAAPFSVAVDGTAYVFGGATTNGSTSTIYGFTTTNGVLAATSQASFSGPTTLTKLAVDRTKGFLIAQGYASGSGLQVYSIGTAGALTQYGTVGTGTSTTVPSYIALTH